MCYGIEGRTIIHFLPLCSSSSLVMLVVRAWFLELSRLSASLSKFLTRLSSLSSRFSHSRSFFLSSNKFSASFRRFISFCSRRVRYLQQTNKNNTSIPSINQLIYRQNRTKRAYTKSTEWLAYRNLSDWAGKKRQVDERNRKTLGSPFSRPLHSLILPVISVCLEQANE